jgi:membrane protein DedA with SNARE-associated domain
MTVETLVTAIVDFVREHEGWAVPVAFLVAFGESFCFLSLLWPGTAILAGLAALLAASGVSDSVIVPAALGAAAGGALGYAVSYWIGRYFKDSIHKIWPFSTRPHLIEEGQEFFARYGAFGVFLGHFFGPVRAVIPVVAGMFAMPQLPFQIANILSALIWAAGIVAPAFYLVQFKEPVLALLREYEWVVALVLFSLALANAVPRPLLYFPTLLLFILIGALHLFAGGSFLTIWIAGAAGALAGDLYAFRLGKKYEGNLKGAWPWTADSASRKAARQRIESQGLAAVATSKFRGFDRGLVPLMAGATRMASTPFVAASLASALVWSAILLLPAIAIEIISH